MRHKTFAGRAILLALAVMAQTTLACPPATALAEEPSGYSVGTPVEHTDDEWDYPHRYSYPSRDFSTEGLPVEMREEDVSGMQVFILANSFEGDLSGKKKVLLVHGGAFVNQLTTDHLWFAAHIAKATGAVVYLPAYPIANESSSYRSTYPPMFDLYRFVSEKSGPGNFFVLGDSAGAGLAIGLCQLVSQTEGLEQPANLILISPWANVSIQPWDGLEGAADAWAGDGSQKAWQVSPIYGSMGGLRRVTIYNGEADGLADSIEMLYHQLRGNNVDCQLISMRNAVHDYAYLLPRDEAIKTFNLICSSITGRLSPQDNDMTWMETIAEVKSFDNGYKNKARTPKALASSPAYEGK